MLLKLENFYLAVLRFVVIVASGILLVGALVLGAQSLPFIQSELVRKDAAPSVPDETLRAAVVASQKQGAAVPPGEKQNLSEADPNQPYYDRATLSINILLSKAHLDKFTVDKEFIAMHLKKRAGTYSSASLAQTYARGIAESLERLATDEAIIDAARRLGPQVVDTLINSYTEHYDQQVNGIAAENQAAKNAYLEKRKDSLNRIKMAAGAFGPFLLIVFLSIVIRIERNLRHLAPKEPDEPDEPLLPWRP